MSCCLRLAVVNRVTGDIVQTLERLGSRPRESWSEIEAAMIATHGSFSKVLRLSENDLDALPDPAIHRYDAASDWFVTLPVVIDPTFRNTIMQRGLDAGANQTDADANADEEIARIQAGPTDALTKVNRYEEG